MPAATLRARLLGSFELDIDGRAVPAGSFERPSGLRLLKLLLATPGHRVRREEAAELLWPESEPERSSANLRKAIHFARRATAGSDLVRESPIGGDGSTIAVDTGTQVDVDELSEALVAIERIGSVSAVTGQTDPSLSTALDILIRLGDQELLPGDPYEEWLVPLRERLRQRTMAGLLSGAGLARAGADRARAFALIERLLVLEPADERAHRLAIELHLADGELHAARRQLQACRHAVAEAYGVEPDPELGALIETAAAQRPRAADVARLESPIVGRRRELGAAEGPFDAVTAGGTAAILLRGPAGIGKSRVLRELAASARASGWPIIDVRGLEESSGGPFAGIATAIEATLGADAALALDEPARSALLVAVPGSAGKATVEFASDIAIQRALLDGIAVIAANRAAAIVVDDAQWLDDASLDLLVAALATPRPHPLLVLIAVRDDPALLAGPVSGLLAAVERSGAEEIALGPLGPREIRVVIERDVVGEPLDDELAMSIATLAAGTPLFAIELFRSARETGLLEQQSGRWTFRRGVDALRIPESVARLVDRRVGRLGGDARVILATAAELGDIVGFEDLVATGMAADEVLDAVEAALAGGIVVESLGRYTFSHPLYRAALRRSLPPRDRANVHVRIAETLSRGIDPFDDAAVRRAGAIGVDILAIATHAATAAELGRSDAARIAVGFGLAAGERQAYLFDFASAVTTLQRALRIWQRMPTPDRALFPITRGDVELGQALRRTGDDTGAAAAFESAIAGARDDDELATAYSAASWLPYEHGRFGPALAILEEGARRITEPVAIAKLNIPRGWIMGRDGHWPEATPLLSGAVTTLEALGPSTELMRALDRLAIANRDGGEVAASIPILERALHMASELGLTGERATFEMHLAGSLHQVGRYDEAMTAIDRALVLCRLSGDRYIESVTEWIAAEIEESRDHFAEAIGHRRRELEIFGDIGGNPRHEALAHAHIAHLAGRLGDGSLAKAEAAAARFGARHSGIDGLEARVEWALATPDWFAPQPG